MDIEKAPPEVLKAWVYTSGHIRYCGADTYKEIMDTIDKYPEYFPWETKYKSIPDEVHLKYKKLKDELYNSIYPPEPNDLVPGEGIYVQIRKQPIIHPAHLTKEKLREVCHELFYVVPKRKQKYEEGKRKLWYELYSKYKLKYRET